VCCVIIQVIEVFLPPMVVFTAKHAVFQTTFNFCRFRSLLICTRVTQTLFLNVAHGPPSRMQSPYFSQEVNST
uniref:Uncharacterized protein n=1 Tax=Sparus aurata TaxID=8175 RepID=A0A671WMW0_SPAAU